MTAIFQFGTSRFLQAHVALFAWEARQQGQDVPPITVVQTTMDPARAKRVAAFNDAQGYPVILRGLSPEREPVEETIRVRSVTRGIAAATQWEALKEHFRAEADYVISNTGDSGYQVADSDRQPGAIQPQSFPAMLLALLRHRWQAGGAPVTILPCELVYRNGATLRGILADLAAAHRAEPEFIAWLTQECLWVNSLVDRIVSEPIEPVGAVAEPYTLWAVERQAGLVMPFAHPDVVLTDDLEPYERLKVHILNLGHSWMAQQWLESGKPEGGSVGDVMRDEAVRSALERLYAQEVIPGFAAHGLGDQARDYVEATLTRFANPFLNHRLSDIANGHGAKVEKRVAGFVNWVGQRDGALPMPELRHLIASVAAPQS
jgi:tagaturonate reductase